MYESGEFGDEVNYSKAHECYMQAAKLGNTKAMLNLGNMYEKGKGVEKDQNEAQKFYQLAASKGDHTALNILKSKFSAENLKQETLLDV